jgi:hypothetical protein
MRNASLRRRRILLLLPLLLQGILTACQPAVSSSAATESASRIVAVPVTYSGGVAAFDNGQLVESPFLESYRGMEGERWLGRPITRAFDDADLGWRVQVFEFGVLAKDPADEHVFLTNLGDLLGRRQPGVADSGSAGCQYSSRTGHNLCYQFLDFVRAAGEAHFGQPVSEMTMGAEGLIYQDFEYARLLWYGGGMDREHAGETFFAQRGYDPALREPMTGMAGPAAGQVQLYASLARPTLQPGETQILRVVLVDATGAGVAGAALQVVVEKDGQALLEIALPPTDAGGMASLSFRVPEAEPGTRIRVMVRGEWETKPLEAVAEFEVWW